MIFSSRTMHSVAKNQDKFIKYGLYLSFFPAGNRDHMAVYNIDKFNWHMWSPHAREGDTETADRIRSYTQGTAPYKYPGFKKKIHI